MENKYIRIYDSFCEEDFCRGIIENLGSFKPVKNSVQFGVSFFNLSGVLRDKLEKDYAKTISKYLVDFNYYHALKIESMEILHYSRNAYCENHTDRELLPDGSHVLLSTIVFLNDDFDGGVLNFKDQNVSIEPKTGRLVIFPAGFIFPHSVSNTSSSRYVLSANFSVA